MAASVVLIPGICSIGSVFYPPLKSELEARGFNEVLIIDNPSVDPGDNIQNLTPNALEADVHHVRSVVTKLVDDNKDVIVVGHSYGGTVALHGCHKQWKHVRSVEGKAGGVLKAVLLSSSIALPGEIFGGKRMNWLSANSPALAEAEPGATNIEMILGVPCLKPVGLEPFFFSDMSAEEQKDFTTRGLRLSPISCMTSPGPEGNVTDWRAAYLITEADPSMPVDFQQYLIDDAKKHGARIEEVKPIKSGHFAQNTHTAEVADWILSLSK